MAKNKRRQAAGRKEVQNEPEPISVTREKNENATGNKILLLTTADGKKDLLWDEDGPYDGAMLRLQTRFSEWLKMENICVLAGAGTSKEHEGLLLKELSERLISLLEKYYESKKRTDCLKGLCSISTAVKNDPAGLEKWMSQLSGISHVLESSAIGETTIEVGNQRIDPAIIKNILNDIGRFVFLLCTLKLDSQEKTSQPTGHHSFIAKLISRDSSLGRVKLFTLNYDTLFEEALDDLGILYADGFVGSVNRRFNPSCYGLDYYYPGEISEGRVRRYDKFMHLYKLHGSINWREPDTRGDPVESVPVDLSRMNSFRQAITKTIKSKLNFDEMTIAGVDSLLSESETIGVLPISNKYVETLQMPYAHMFRAFQESLQKPQTFLLIVGYGFGDDHVNRIIEDALANPSLIVCIVEPYALNRFNKVKNKKIGQYLSLEMKGRIFLLTERNPEKSKPETGFEGLSVNLMPNVKMLEQWMKLRKLEHKLRGRSAEEELEKMGDNDEG